jgi:hypothetical protein
VDASVELACNMVLSLLVSQQSDMDLELLAEHVAPS